MENSAHHQITDPVALFQHGYRDTISIIPPGATLVATSKIPAASIGKIPGRKVAGGKYAGFHWQAHETTQADVARWQADGSSLGLRSAWFPGIDIDCTDSDLADAIHTAVTECLGSAPCRIGRPPKRLLMYRLDGEPFGRMRLWMKSGDASHLVEILGSGQQYVISGIHPGTMRPYTWDRELPAASELPPITREMAGAMLSGLADMLRTLGYEVAREGDGRPPSQVTAASAAILMAPSIDALREAVALLPNDTPSRDDYIKMGQAIKAAAGDDDGAGYEIFASWADKWAGNHNGPNQPETVRADWRRMHGTRSVGWAWIAEQARGFGFNDAALDFNPVASQPTALVLPAYSDPALANLVVATANGDLRYVEDEDRWIEWDGSRWSPAKLSGATRLTLNVLKTEAGKLMRTGATAAEKAKSERLANRVCSADTVGSVLRLVKVDSRVIVGVAALDSDPWQLGTSAGVFNLRTGELVPANRDALVTRSTSVAPDATMPTPIWTKFLKEATGGDSELLGYLQRLAGYCLSGTTREQQLAYLHGSGGNGKGIFVGVLTGILGDYAFTPPAATFAESRGFDAHTTDLAALAGKRLVVTPETEAGRRLNEARIKQITGGDKVTARFMRSDNVEYQPQCKLLFLSNNKPRLTDLGDSMRRRFQLVPFTHKPPVVDHALADKLKAEYPGILAWMIHGCLEWQQRGLDAPAVVREATSELFANQNPLFTWAMRIVRAGDLPCMAGGVVRDKEALLRSYRECGLSGSAKDLVAASTDVFGDTVDTVARLPRPSRAHVYTFSPLAECRQQVAQRFGVPIDVDESVTEWPAPPELTPVLPTAPSPVPSPARAPVQISVPAAPELEMPLGEFNQKVRQLATQIGPRTVQQRLAAYGARAIEHVAPAQRREFLAEVAR